MSTEKSCNDWQDLLPAYHNERLGVDDRAALTGHLATCANCQSALAQWRTITATLQASAQAVPPPPSEASLWAALGPLVRAEGGRAAVLDAPTRNGHHLPAEAGFTLRESTIARVPFTVPRQGPRSYAIVAAVAVVALLVALFSTLASHRGSTVPVPLVTPTTTPIALPAAYAIPNNLLATAAIGGSDFWIGGDDLLAHYNGQGGWQRISIPLGAIIESIAMVTPTEGWAVGYASGSQPIMLHEHDGTWQNVSLPGVANGLMEVRMASADDGWAWNNGTLLHYTGGQWAIQSTPFAQTGIADLATVAPGEAWLTFEHTIWHFHNGAWTAEGDLGTLYISQLSMVSATEGWGMGLINGLKGHPVVNDLWHYDGKVWSQVTPAPDLISGSAYGINQLFINNHDDGWAAVALNTSSGPQFDGHILRYHAGQWSLVAIPAGLWVHAVITLGPDNAWAIADDGSSVVLLHYSGGVWLTK